MTDAEIDEWLVLDFDRNEMESMVLLEWDAGLTEGEEGVFDD